MNDLVKWVLKTLLQGCLWVFLLSIHVKSKPVFFYAYDVLIDNAVVAWLDESVSDILQKSKISLRNTLEDKQLEKDTSAF